MMDEDPATAVRLLQRSIHGCLSLRNRWERLLGSFDKAGCWFEGEAARLFLRYHAESRNAFLRAFGKLEATLKTDADGAVTGSPAKAVWNEIQWRNDLLMEDASPLERSPEDSEPESSGANLWIEPEDFHDSGLRPGSPETDSPSEAVFENIKGFERSHCGIVKAVVAACFLILYGLSRGVVKGADSPGEAVLGRTVPFRVCPERNWLGNG